MAKLIQAYSAYGPKIDLMEAAAEERFMELITFRTTLSSGVVKNVQESEVETLIGLLKEGRPVHTGIAIFTPTIDGQGNLNVSVRVDKRITSKINETNAFVGKINNSANIGMTREQYVAKWNEDNPDNPIVIEPPFQVSPGLQIA